MSEIHKKFDVDVVNAEFFISSLSHGIYWLARGYGYSGLIYGLSFLKRSSAVLQGNIPGLCFNFSNPYIGEHVQTRRYGQERSGRV